jgi:hypothetical protein
MNVWRFYFLEPWLKTRGLKKKENAKHDKLHDNTEINGATGTSGTIDKLQEKRKYDDC